VRLWHLSRRLWLLLCSGTLLAGGLALFALRRWRKLFLLAMLILMSAVLTVGLLWPGWVPPFILGCQPGLLVLVVLLGVQWMLQESYRRRLVFMPGFTRLKANSSLLRSAASGQRREPSTVDAPAASASSPAGPNTGT
jgi:hypothetical protein